MNFYEKRLHELNFEDLPKQVSSDNRHLKLSNQQIWDKLEVGSKIYVTAWFLRNILEVEKVQEIAKNGLTVVEKGHINDPQAEYDYVFGWKSGKVDALFFEETATIMNFKYKTKGYIWKIEDEILA